MFAALLERKTIFLTTFALVLGAALIIQLKPGGEGSIGGIVNILNILFSLLAVVALGIVPFAFKRREPQRVSWMLIAAGVFCYFLGESAWALLSWLDGNEVPFPSIADAFWLLGYIPLYWGLISVNRTIKARLWIREALTLGLFSIVITFVMSYFVFWPIITSTEISLVEKVLDLAYPLLDMFLLLMACSIMLLYEKGVFGAPWLIIMTSFIAFSFSDILFSYLTWNDLYREGDFVDLGWLVAYALIMAGAWLQTSILRHMPPMFRATAPFKTEIFIRESTDLAQPAKTGH